MRLWLTLDEVPDHAKPAKNPQRPVVPFEGVQIGQWYSAAVDIERQGKKTWGGVKHRILVTAKDESLHTLSCVFNTTFGGTSPEEFTQKKTSKGKSTRPRETWEYLPTPSTRRLVSIPTYDTVRSYPPVIKGFVNFSSIIKVRCNPGVKARELPRVIPEAKPKLLVGPVRDPKLAGQYEPVCSPDYTRVYMNHLRSEFTVLDRTNSKSDWVRTAAVVLQRLSKERKIELELWEEEWTVCQYQLILHIAGAQN